MLRLNLQIKITIKMKKIPKVGHIQQLGVQTLICYTVSLENVDFLLYSVIPVNLGYLCWVFKTLLKSPVPRELQAVQVSLESLHRWARSTRRKLQ